MIGGFKHSSNKLKSKERFFALWMSYKWNPPSAPGQNQYGFLWCHGRRTYPMHVWSVTAVKGDISTLKGIPRLSFIYHDFCHLPHSTLAKIFWYPQCLEFKYCSIQSKILVLEWVRTSSAEDESKARHRKTDFSGITTIGKVKMFYFWKYML